MSKVLFIPSQLTEYWIVDFVKELFQWADENVVDFDFSKIDFARPFGILLLAEELKRFAAIRKTKQLITRAVGHKETTSSLSYLRHVGFFQYIGLNVGNMPGEASGSSSYLPIEQIDINDLRKKFSMPKEAIGQVVQVEAERLSQVVLGIQSIPPNHPVSYCFTEVIRNVFEHGKTHVCSVSAQKYKGKEIEIAIIDRGVGLLESLSERFSLHDSMHAIKLGISPGVSRIASSDVDDPWHNSGFGLYMLSQLAMRTGSFFIASGNAALKCVRDNEEWKDFCFNGTAIRLTIKKQEGTDIRKLLSDIRDEGESKSNANRRASTSSGFFKN